MIALKPALATCVVDDPNVTVAELGLYPAMTIGVAEARPQLKAPIKEVGSLPVSA